MVSRERTYTRGARPVESQEGKRQKEILSGYEREPRVREKGTCTKTTGSGKLGKDVGRRKIWKEDAKG